MNPVLQPLDAGREALATLRWPLGSGAPPLWDHTALPGVCLRGFNECPLCAYYFIYIYNIYIYI